MPNSAKECAYSGSFIKPQAFITAPAIKYPKTGLVLSLCNKITTMIDDAKRIRNKKYNKNQIFHSIPIKYY